MIRTLKEQHPGKWSISYVFDEEASRFICDTKDKAFFYAARAQAFSDISDTHDIRVHHAGRTYHYAGWQPGMLIEFNNKIGTPIWGCRFPEWDH